MFRLISAFFASTLWCVPLQAFERPSLPNYGQLHNGTPVPIVTWNDGRYVLVPSGRGIGQGLMGVSDCDWYFNPYTQKWVKIDPFDTLTFHPILIVTPERERYTDGTAASDKDPITPSTVLPRGPNTPEEWEPLPPVLEKYLQHPGVTSPVVPEPAPEGLDGPVSAPQPESEDSSGVGISK